MQSELSIYKKRFYKRFYSKKDDKKLYADIAIFSLIIVSTKYQH